MDLEDFLVSDHLLPIGSLMFVLFCTSRYGWGFDQFLEEANLGHGVKLGPAVRLYMTYLLPLLVIGIYLKGIYSRFRPDGTGWLGWNQETLFFVLWMGIAWAYIGFVFWLRGNKKEKSH